MEGASCTMVSAHRLTWSMWIGQSTPFLEEKINTEQREKKRGLMEMSLPPLVN